MTRDYIELHRLPTWPKSGVYTEDGFTEVIETGNCKALQYEVLDMESSSCRKGKSSLLNYSRIGLVTPTRETRA